jgi:hypothetical protein
MTEAERFLRAGGRLTLSEWAAMAPDMQDAMLDAAALIDEERALGAAHAIIAAARDAVADARLAALVDKALGMLE